MCCLAGPVGESLYTGRPVLELFQDRRIGATDYRMALHALALSSRDYNLQAVINATQMMVDQHWHPIQRLASVLVDRRHLTYAQVSQLMEV